MRERAYLREVGPRDGLQLVKTIVSTERKIAWCRAEAAARGVLGADAQELPLERILPAGPRGPRAIVGAAQARGCRRFEQQGSQLINRLA